MKLSSPDDLAPKERAAFDALAKHFPKGAVCVNVMVGVETWDVRPLLLINGAVVLYRHSRSLPFDMLRHVAAEMEGFSLLPGWNTAVRVIPASDKFLLSRPFVQATLQDHLSSASSIVQSNPLAVAVKLISQIQLLDQRGLIHGHITPSNVALSAHSAEGLFLLDPRVGALMNRKDESVAPELEPMQDPPRSADVYGLGLCLKAVMQGSATPLQNETIERMLLASPRQRPDLSAVMAAFSPQHAGTVTSEKTALGGRGKILTPNSAAATPQPPRGTTEEVETLPSATLPSSAPNPGSTARVVQLIPSMRTTTAAALTAVALLVVLAWRFPKAYYEIAYYVPILASQSNPEFIASLASGDRARIRSVARAALIERNPAAINAILEDVSSGSVRPGFNPAIAKVCYRGPWIDEFSRSDIRTIIALTVAPILPEALAELPPLSSLHPSIIVAIAAQLAPSASDPKLDAIPIGNMFALGDPEGTAFEKLQAVGVKSMGQPEAIALCQLIAGTATTGAYDTLIGSSGEVAPTLDRLAAILPVVMAKPALADQLLASLRDRGGDLGNVLSWFDIDSLVGWAKVPSVAKLLLLLQQVPSASLTGSHYADLLKFPLPIVRQKAAVELKERFLREGESGLLLLLASDQNRLSREQTVALISGLTLEQQKRPPFIALWFQMQPPADTVLLVLLGRSGFDGNDLFNLEAARYLKKNSWQSNTEILKLLVQHPEPLARTLAYAKLDPNNPEQRVILQERVSAEKDKSLLKLVTTKLSPGTPQSAPLPDIPALQPTGVAAVQR